MFYRFRLFVTLLSILSLIPVPVQASEAEAKDLIQRYIEHCLDGADLACLDEYWVPDRAVKVRKSEELRRSLFPDLSFKLVELIADGDRVAALLKVSGTHRGKDPLSPSEGKPPIPPSHNRLETEEIAMYIVSDGRIQRGRLFSDKLAVAKALGYTVLPPETE